MGPFSLTVMTEAQAVPSVGGNRQFFFMHDKKYFTSCALGGALACGTTHTALTPLDLVKCRAQFGLTTPASSLVVGWSPTLIGYSLQGAFKFGLYEVFKDALGVDDSPLVWCGASAAAELCADVALCPFEMVKVRMQTAANDFPRKLVPAFKHMWNVENAPLPFGSLKALWTRQVPYTVAKFCCFERCVQLCYGRILGGPKDSYSKATQLGVTLSSGYAAGVICALVSQPADVLITHLSKPSNTGKNITAILRGLAMRDLFSRGFGHRLIMIGGLTGAQWLCYDAFKTAVGLSTTGGR